MKVFVPGRICLFGEHTDWAGGYRRFNADLERGYTLITGTNQGLYAEVKPHPNKLIFTSTLDTGERAGTIEFPMDRDLLLEEAQKGGFFSYIAGVAYHVVTHYKVRGLEIDNYRTDLPVRKGLSSSAAVCVLTARAFNRVYDLKMTTRGEMEFAYLGEITTPSRCGRMDQGCAYGNKPILMTYDGDRVDVTEVTVAKDLYLVIVDLKAGKDTKEILKHLNQSYPFADNDRQRAVQEYLGPVSKDLVHRALNAITKGDAETLGAIMTEAQTKFDAHLMDACPSQLTAPVLHKVLSYEPLKPYIYGGKGVGSQGDGTAQFLARDRESQKKVVEIIENDLAMDAMELIIHSGRKVRKALIPAAGYGTAMFPATKTIEKELFPVLGADGKVKPIIQHIVEEALSAGVEEVGIVVKENTRHLFEDFFTSPPPLRQYNNLSKEDQEYLEYLYDIGGRITFITQESQEGLGHAVYCARDFIGDEAFLLLLGDHLYTATSDTSCAKQVLEIFERTDESVVSVMETTGERVAGFGCVTGEWEEEGTLLGVTTLYEKPTLDYARTHLTINGMPEDTFLTAFGQYVLKPNIFDYLEENVEHNVREGGEFQLTSCLDRLRRENGLLAYVVKGMRYDIGNPKAYCRTLASFAESAKV